MREGWVRHAEPVSVSAEQAAALLRPALGEACIRDIRPVTGGLVNTNLRVALDRPPGTVLLRLITREPPQARKEAALSRLLAGRVPIARFLHLAETNPITRGPYAVLEWIEGERLDRAAAGADAVALDGLGEAVGAVLARVHAFRFAQHGFLTPDLRTTAPIGFDRAALLDFLRECLIRGPGGARLGLALTDRVLDFAAREGWRLDAWRDDPRLVHADLNPSNILMRDGGVAGVLDWEFALSATPGLDFGNLLRPPLGTRPGFADGSARGYRRGGGVLPADWQRIARIADLFAWADLLGRRPLRRGAGGRCEAGDRGLGRVTHGVSDLACSTPAGVSSSSQWHCRSPAASRTGSRISRAARQRAMASANAASSSVRPSSASIRCRPSSALAARTRWRNATASSAAWIVSSRLVICRLPPDQGRRAGRSRSVAPNSVTASAASANGRNAVAATPLASHNHPASSAAPTDKL